MNGREKVDELDLDDYNDTSDWEEIEQTSLDEIDLYEMGILYDMEYYL